MIIFIALYNDSLQFQSFLIPFKANKKHIRNIYIVYINYTYSKLVNKAELDR